MSRRLAAAAVLSVPLLLLGAWAWIVRANQLAEPSFELARELLWARMRDPTLTHYERMTAARTIGLRSDCAIPKLQELLESEDAGLRRMGIIALVGAGSRALPALPDLYKRCDDPNVEVAGEALVAVSRRAPADPRTHAAVRKAFLVADPKLEIPLHMAMGNVESPPTDLLLTAAVHPGKYFQGWADHQLQTRTLDPKVVSKLVEKWIPTASGDLSNAPLIRGLERGHRGTLLPAIRKAARGHPDPTLRLSAISFLDRSPGTAPGPVNSPDAGRPAPPREDLAEFTPFLEPIAANVGKDLKPGLEAMQLLSRSGKGQEALHRLMSHEESFVRFHATWHDALARRMPVSLQFLIAGLKDEDERVQEACLWGLRDRRQAAADAIPESRSW